MKKECIALWEWFVEKSSQLSGNSPPSAVIEELDRRVLAAGDVCWEIGHQNGVPYLAISPGENIDDARQILATAPTVPGWVIRLYKPPKKWNMKFRVLLAGGEVEIDGSQWEFVCYKVENGQFDLVFRAPSGLDVDDQKVWDTALTIVDGELGEEARRTYISRVEVQESWSDRESTAARKLEVGRLAELVLPKN